MNPSDEERETEPATRATLRMVRQSPAPTDDSDARPALVVDTVGREREFALLLSAWEAARDQRGRHLHVTALAGIGKSRLLGDVHARLVAARGKALLIRANPGEHDLPYTLAATLATALAALPGARGVSSASAAALLALTPAVSSWIHGAADPATGDEALRRRRIAVGELLANVAAEHPVAVLVDDLHWADASSRQLLQGVAARCSGMSALLVTASRPLTDAAAGDLPEEALTLAAFKPSDVLELLARVGSLPDEPWALALPDDLTRATGGSPLLVLETLHLLLERDALRLNADGWSVGAADRLHDLLGAGSAISRRLEQLSRPEFWLLLLLATSGTPVPTAALASMSAVLEGETLETLGVLERRGLVTSAGGRWQSAHDEISEQVPAVTPPDARRAAHLAIAR